MTPKARPIWTPGAWLAEFIKGTTKHCYILKCISCGPHGFREEFLYFFFHYKSMGANDPLGHGQLGPQWIYVGDHQTLLHTKYISCGPHGFREK